MLAKVSREYILNWHKEHLWDTRYSHILGVEESAIELAKKFGVDHEKAALAGLTHDCAKWMKVDQLIAYAQDHNLPLSQDHINAPAVLHSVIGPYLATEEFGIIDSSVLNAMRFHTLGDPNMDNLAKVVFIADKIEKNTRDPFIIQQVSDAMEKEHSLDSGLIECYRLTLNHLISKKQPVHPTTIAVWNKLCYGYS